MNDSGAHLDRRSVDVEFLEDCKRFFVELAVDSDIRNIWGIVIVKPVDVLHDPGPISLYSGQDEQVLQIPVKKKRACKLTQEKRNPKIVSNLTISTYR